VGWGGGGENEGRAKCEGSTAGKASFGPGLPSTAAYYAAAALAWRIALCVVWKYGVGGVESVEEERVANMAVAALPCVLCLCLPPHLSPHIHSHTLAQLPYFAQDDDGMQVAPPALVASALASS